MPSNPGRWYVARQAGVALLTANAIRPLNTPRTAIPAFAAGWLTSELAPQLLALTAVDTLASAGRRRAPAAGVALAAASAAGLGWVVRRAGASATVVEASLREGIGEDYREVLETPVDPADLRPPLRRLARPFRFADPAVEVIRDISYTEGGRRARLDVYRPRDGDLADAPVLVQVHGGAWTIGRKEEQGLLLMNRMAARGWVCVALNYRLAPRHRWPAQIVDVKKAIAWVREHVAEYGGDPAYVAITGGSAGGHLAALAALTPDVKQFQPGFEDADTSVVACVPFYGVYDMAGDDGDPYAVGLRDGLLARKVFSSDPAQDLDEYRQASPLHQVTEDAPDFLVFHGANDTLVSVRQARAFVAELRRRSRASVTYAELPSAQHAFEIFGSIRSHHVIRAAARWLEWHHATWRAARDRQAS
ncbi:MAG: alpha/beta hydrolase fold domain-containing protein [Marmoricola sp.]